MKLTITVDERNSAFEEDEGELARLLVKAAVKAANGNTSGNLFDFNGNMVGNYRVTGGKK